MSEQLHRQRVFYEETLANNKKRFEQDNEQLDKLIEELERQKNERTERLKKEQKKKRKLEKRVSEMR